MGSKILELNVVSARDLKDVATLGMMSPYCVVTLSIGGFKQRTPTATKAGCNPKWNAKFSLHVQESLLYSSGAAIMLQIMHDGSFGDSLVGTAYIPVKDFVEGGGQLRETAYQVSTKSGKQKGSVIVTLRVADGQNSNSAQHMQAQQQLPFPAGSGMPPPPPPSYPEKPVKSDNMPSAPAPVATTPNLYPPPPLVYPPTAFAMAATTTPSPSVESGYAPQQPEKQQNASVATAYPPGPAAPGTGYPPSAPSGGAQAQAVPAMAYPPAATAYPPAAPSGGAQPAPAMAYPAGVPYAAPPAAYQPPPPTYGGYPQQYPQQPYAPPPGYGPPPPYYAPPPYQAAGPYQQQQQPYQAAGPYPYQQQQRPHRFGGGGGMGMGTGAMLGLGAGLLGGLLVADAVDDVSDAFDM